MKIRKNLLGAVILITSSTLGSFGYAAWTDNVLPVENLATVASCSDVGKMYLNQDNDGDTKADYYLYLNNNFILNGTANTYTAGQILRTDSGVNYTTVKYYTPLTNMIYKVDTNNVVGALDGNTFWRASRVFPYNTPLRGIATTPNKVIFEQPSDNDPNKNIISIVYDYRYKYALGFDGTTASSYRYNQVPDMGYMLNDGLSYITTLPGSEGNRKRSRSPVQSTSSCKNYELHRCGNGIVETSNSSYINSFTSEQCDGTAGVPAGSTCTSICTLQTTVIKPTCTLSVSSGSLLLGASTQASWNISGNYTNTPQITYTPMSSTITGLPYTVPTVFGQRSITPQTTGAYVLSMTVSNSAGSSTCTAPLVVTPPAQNLQCFLTLSPNPVSVNQIVSVGWNVIGGNFAGTYINVTPAIGGAWPHRVNANQYTGTTSIMPTQVGDYTFTMLVNNNLSSAACTGILHVVASAIPTCSLTTTTPSITSGQTALLSASYTNAISTTITPTLAGLNFTYPNRSNNTISVNPTSTTTYIMTVNGATGTSPAICQTTITVSNNIALPTCSLTTTTPSITSGQTALLSASYTNASLATFTPNIIGLNFIYPNRSNNTISVNPTSTTTYTLTTLGLGGTSGVVCSTTINVINSGLSLNKTLVNDIPYRPGDLVSFRIDFANLSASSANNIILDDYLPGGLDYVSSQIFGIPSYRFGTGMSGGTQFAQYSGFNLSAGQQGYFIIIGRFKGYTYANQTVNNVFLRADNFATLHASALFRVYVATANAIITKIADKYSYTLGENVRYTVKVTNNGPDTIDAVKIIDTWPNTSCIAADSLRSSNMPMTIISASNPYIWTLNTSLPAGQSVYLYLTGHIATTQNCVGNHTNQVELNYMVNGQPMTGNASVVINVTTLPDTGKCQDLHALDGNVALYQNGIADSTFRCETKAGTIAQTMIIDCGNGTQHTAYNTSSYEAACRYTNVSVPQTYNVRCFVDGVNPPPACVETLIVDEGKMGYCGDGIREGYEKCDLGTNNGRAGYNCTNGCDIKGSSMVGCFNIGNTNVSIQKGELLPFRWTLDYKSNIINGNSCVGQQNGKVPADTIMCTFNIYNGAHTEADEDPVYTFTKRCNEDNRGSYLAFKYFLDKQNERLSLKNAFGKYYIDSHSFVTDIFGEYKISLDKVSYKYCLGDNKESGTEIDRVCSVNFTVTQPYIAQKSSFGLTPKATTISLDGYKMLDGTDLISNTDLSSIMVINEATYAGGRTITTMMDNFITKYKKLAVKYGTIRSDENNTITTYKVPGQDIVVFKGTGTLTYSQAAIKTKPFTVILDGPSIKINGSIENTNAMFLLNKGNITFLPSADACSKTQIVKGIFVTSQGSFLAGPDLTNTNINKKWCAFGGLKVPGILIGNGIEDLVQSRRSQLNGWFYVGGSSLSSIKSERRNEIFNGASVLIEYSPSLRSALPPGASEFTKALDIYKQ